VAELQFNISHYRQIHETKKLHKGIRQSQQLIKEAEKEYEDIIRIEQQRTHDPIDPRYIKKDTDSKGPSEFEIYAPKDFNTYINPRCFYDHDGYREQEEEKQ
jgi:hypothetical protein